MLRSRLIRHAGIFALWLIALFGSILAYAQDLSPRAYVITPLHANALTVTYAYSTGQVDFNGAIPISGASGSFSTPSIAYYHSFNFFGRSANVLAALPYGVGNFQGKVMGQQGHLHKSGLFDSVFRVSVNLIGGPALEPRQFAKWKQKTLLGVSLKVIPPTGQYDTARIVNWSTNRWSFKPELGYSRRFHQRWLVDAYGGAWFFTTNPEFPIPPTTVTQTQTPIGSFEGHLSRDIKPPFLWLSLDGNFWWGGTVTNGGITQSNTRQTASRIGLTGSFPVAKNQSIKASFSTGAYVSYGGDYRTLSVAWQYSWFGKPR